VEDFRNLPQYPCARESLLYGIASGTAIGAVRTMNTNIRVASNWAVGTFIFVSAASWTICRAARARELRTTQAIIEKYPERNVRIARQRAEEKRRLQQQAGQPEGADVESSSQHHQEAPITPVAPVRDEWAGSGEMATPPPPPPATGGKSGSRWGWFGGGSSSSGGTAS